MSSSGKLVEPLRRLQKGKTLVSAETPSEDSICGLCARCRHVRQVRSCRDSVFYLCRRAATDSRFPRYPSLPMPDCSGYEAAEK